MVDKNILEKLAIKFEGLQNKHQVIISQDHMMEGKLKEVVELLRDGSPSKQIADKIDDLSAYARDMAEEEQRILAESEESAAGNEEEDSARYFEFVKDINQLEEEYTSN